MLNLYCYGMFQYFAGVYLYMVFHGYSGIQSFGGLVVTDKYINNMFYA